MSFVSTKAFAIAAKEIKSSFSTPLAYVLLAGFLLLSGFFFFTLLTQFNEVLSKSQMLPTEKPSLNEWVVIPFYQTLEILLVFLVPILTMRSIAEERQLGTFELLATSPLSVSEIVFGKFLGTVSVVFIMLLFSFSFPFVLILFSDPEIMPIFIGFFGLCLFAFSFISIGIAVSSFSKNQTIAGFITLVLLLVFYIIGAPADKLQGTPAAVLRYLTPSTHSEILLKGVITGVDLVYFFSLIAFGLFVANRVLDAERWR